VGMHVNETRFVTVFCCLGTLQGVPQTPSTTARPAQDTDAMINVGRLRVYTDGVATLSRYQPHVDRGKDFKLTSQEA